MSIYVIFEIIVGIYVFVAAIVYGVMTYIRDDSRVDPEFEGTNGAIAFFWPLIATCYIIGSPFILVYYIGKKLRKKHEQRRSN